MIAQVPVMTLIQNEKKYLQRKADLWHQFRLHTMLWCSKLGVQYTKEHYAGASHYLHGLSSHHQVSGVGKNI
jgi:hypothetical protein